MRNLPRVGVVILNFERPGMTVECVRSFQKKVTYPNYSILLVDNGSSDDSLSIFKSALDNIDILALESNTGYTGGNNAGARYLIKAGVDYLHILNNDTSILDGSYLSTMIDFMEKNQDFGIVSPSKVRIPEGQYQPMLTWIPSFSNRILFHLGSSPQTVIPCGVCLLIRSTVIRQIGLFDESFFMYEEELDFGERAIEAGWKTGSVDTESIIHHVGKDKVGMDIFSPILRLMRRNRVLILKYRGHFMQAMFLLFMYMAVSTKDFVVSIIRLRPNLKGYLAMCSALASSLSMKPRIGGL